MIFYILSGFHVEVLKLNVTFQWGLQEGNSNKTKNINASMKEAKKLWQ